MTPSSRRKRLIGMLVMVKLILNPTAPTFNTSLSPATGVKPVAHADPERARRTGRVKARLLYREIATHRRIRARYEIARSIESG